jgi:hypothetical protein
MVSAQSQDPTVYFDSTPDSGYSVDNLRPVAPAEVQVHFNQAENILAWLQPVDPDVVAYRIFRSPRDDLGSPETDEPVALVHTTAWTDNLASLPGPGWEYAYAVVAVDDAGNHGVASEWVMADLSAVDEPNGPRAFALLPNIPNPFNPATFLRFSLDAALPVTLAIYDLRGRCVRALLAESSPEPGERAVFWDGTDDRGRLVPAGVYVARLRAGDRVASRRLAMIR